MFRPTGGVVDAGAYRSLEKPYPVTAAEAAALVEQARRAAARKAVPAPRIRRLDPEAARQKAESRAMLAAARNKLAEAEKEAHHLRQASALEAEALHQKAREEGFSQGLASGSEEGYEKGRAKGEEEGLAQWAELVARWQGLLEATHREKQAYFADRERILVELVMRVAAKVLGREVRQDTGEVRQRVIEAAKRVSDRSSLVVRLNPEDLAKAFEEDGSPLKAVQGVKQIEFLADERILRGGVRLESRAETIDAGMDTQLAEIIRGLLQEAYHGD